MTDVYYHGTIWTGRGADAEAMAVKDGNVVQTGTRKEIEAGFGRPASSDGRTDVTYHDLGGRFVVPGFHDSHLHLLNYGRTLSMVNLCDHTSSLAGIQDALRRHMEGESPRKYGWIVGRGWNQDYFRQETRFPTRYDLDMVSTKRPILIIRACGHVACANSKAIEIAKISKATPQPEGGRFDVDEDGEPNGIFRENGVDLINRAMPAPSGEEIKEYLVRAMENLNRFGITSVQSDDLAAFAGLSYEAVLEAYRELDAQGKMTVKVYEQSMLPTMDLLKDFLSRGYCTGAGSAYFRIGPLKLLADGSLGARTAYLSQPYADDARHPDNRGIAIYSQDELNELACYGAARGMQLAIHAIGDQAMEMAVAAVRKAMEDEPEKDLRHGIVHCQITTKRLLEELKELHLHAYIQSVFLDYDSRIVESRIGVERARDTYQFKTLLSMGVSVSNGSDCPVERPDALAGIQCAVTRRTLDGTKEFLKDQAMTVEEALKTYTEYSARASFDEHAKGLLLPKMAADFTILEEDVRRCNPQNIKDVPVCATVVDGRPVYIQKDAGSVFS